MRSRPCCPGGQSAFAVEVKPRHRRLFASTGVWFITLVANLRSVRHLREGQVVCTVEHWLRQ